MGDPQVELLETVFAAISEGVVVHDAHGQIVFCNRAARQLLGLPPDQIRGQTAGCLQPGTIREDGSPLPAAEHPSAITRATGRACAEVVLGIEGDPGRAPTWISVNSSLLPAVAGGGQLVFTAFTDVTARIEARRRFQAAAEAQERLNRALTEQSQFNQAVLDAVPSTIAVLDPDGSIIAVNAAWRRVSLACSPEPGRLAPQTTIGANYLDVCRQAMERADPGARLAYDGIRAVQQGRIPQFSLDYVCDIPSGTLHFTMLVAPLSFKATRSVVVNHIDITARVRAAQSQRRGEEQLRRFFDAHLVGMAITAPDGRFLRVNDRLCRILGYAESELLGQPWAQLIPPEDLASDHVGIRRFLGGEVDEYAGIERFVAKNGEIVQVDLSMVCVRDANGAVDYNLAILVDVTEKKRTEALLLRAQKMDSLGILAGGVAHDFGNLLVAMAGNLDFIRTALPPDHPGRPYLHRVDLAVDRARGLVEQILTFSRQQPAATRTVDLGRVINEVLSLLRQTLPQTITLVEQIQTQAPFVMGDPSLLHQVIMNLCLNGSQALGARSGTITVELALLAAAPRQEAVASETDLWSGTLGPGPHLRLAVEDDGRGIEAGALPRIFEPFFTTRGVEGTGLGLSVVHGIVASHAGAIHVITRPGRGARFEIFLPAAPAQPAKQPDPPSQPSAASKARIMIVDDDLDVMEVLCETLRRLGDDVTAFSRASEALAAFQASPDDWDLVVSDQLMPEMTGLELLAAMLAVRPDLPTILWGARAREIDPQQAAAAGITAILSKSIGHKGLVDRIAAWRRSGF